jgi:hypothetical protein
MDWGDPRDSCLGGLSLGWDLKPGPTEYEAVSLDRSVSYVSGAASLNEGFVLSLDILGKLCDNMCYPVIGHRHFFPCPFQFVKSLNYAYSI